ncbi:GAF domain-containing protein, partial [bacterium]|nr:GAF domain-containing protein [bacterium]
MKEKMLPQIWEAISGSLWVAISVIALFAVISFMWGREKQVLWWLKHNLLFWNRNNYKDVLGDHIRKINSFSNSPGLHTEILSAICEISGATDASLLLGSDFNSFQVKASVGSSPMSFVVEELEAFLKWLSEQRGVITKEYIDNQPVQNGLNHIRIRYFVQFHAEVCVPLFLNKQLIGVINLGQRRFGDYEKNVCDLVMILCEYCAALLQNRELLETVRSDGLKIKQVDQLRNQLISNMSHEFRTPLNSIIGLAELIVEGGDGEVNEEQIKHLSMISQSGKRLLMAVSSMLDLAKIQSNKL